MSDDAEMEELRQEFTKRIGETDAKLQAVVKVCHLPSVASAT